MDAVVFGLSFGVHELAAAALGALLGSGAGLELPEQRARVVVDEVPTVDVGADGALSLTLLETPAAGFPLAVAIDDSPLSLRDQRLGWGDVVDPLAHQPRLSAPFTAPETAGSFTVQGRVSYVICSANRCRPRKARIRWQVEVAAPEPPPSAAP